MSEKKISTRLSPAVESTKMSGGCIAAIVFAVAAVIAAIVVIVLYAVNNKSKTVIVENISVNPTKKPVTTQLAHVSDTDRPRKVIRPQAPADFMPAQPRYAQAPVPVPVVPAPAAPLPVPVVPAPAAPLPVPVVPAPAAPGYLENLHQAVKTADASAYYANATNQVLGGTTVKTDPAEVHAFVQPRLPAMVQNVEGGSLLFGANSAIKSTGTLDASFHDSDIGQFDPEGGRNIDAALALTGTPARWASTPAEEHLNRKAALLNTLRLNGKVDASVEEVLSVGPQTIATKNMVLAAATAQYNLDRNVVNRTPMRQLYATPLIGVRQAVPMPILGATDIEYNKPPGLEIYQTQISCEGSGKPVNLEGY